MIIMIVHTQGRVICAGPDKPTIQEFLLFWIVAPGFRTYSDLMRYITEIHISASMEQIFPQGSKIRVDLR